MTLRRFSSVKKFYLATEWAVLVPLQRLLLANFIVVLLHQFEEYGWPGGFPAVANIVMMRSENPDRYPLNQRSSMIANILFSYMFYLVPVFFPQVIWLGLGPVLVGILQFFGHAIYVNAKIKSIYSPGVATAVLGHLPIAVLYIYTISINHMATGWDWAVAALYGLAYPAFVFGLLEIKILGSKNSPYPFDPDQMERIHIGKRFELARH